MSFAGDHCVHARVLEVASARHDCFSSHHSIERVANQPPLHLVLDGRKSPSGLLRDDMEGAMAVEDLLAATSQQSVHLPSGMNERFVPWLEQRWNQRRSFLTHCRRWHVRGSATLTLTVRPASCCVETEIISTMRSVGIGQSEPTPPVLDNASFKLSSVSNST